VILRPQFESSLLLNAGAWWDPTRRPLDNMVGNGVVLVGDAASLVNPIHGGGIGPSMLSGFQAGKTIVEALEKGEPTQKALWGYNNLYMASYGKKQASLDIFRMLLIGSSDADLNYGMNCKLVTEDDVLKAAMGEDFHLNITETAKRVFRGRKRMGFLTKLRLTVKMMRQVGAHYDAYPTAPENFKPWRLQTVKLVEQGKKKLLD
jgi:digeranylgeranylglycerophospholipid reductase